MVEPQVLWLHLRKNSPYTRPMSMKIIQLREAGIINFLIRKETMKNMDSRIQEKADPILSLEQLQGIFLPCGLLLLICFLVFAIELCTMAYSSRKIAMNNN